MVNFYDENESFPKSSLHLIAEFYGDKYTITFGLSALEAIKAGKVRPKLVGSYCEVIFVV